MSAVQTLALHRPCLHIDEVAQRRSAEGLGGTVLEADRAPAADVTHVVCQHQQQSICRTLPGAEQVSFVWVYQCSLSQRRVSPDEHVVRDGTVLLSTKLFYLPKHSL